jgi:hypothetical protein
VNALLLSNAWEGRRTTTTAAAARFQNVREPEALSLRGRMHVFVRDTPQVDRLEVICDVAQDPGLAFLGCFTDALCPQYSVDVVRPRGVSESISPWVERVDVFALEEI